MSWGSNSISRKPAEDRPIVSAVSRTEVVEADDADAFPEYRRDASSISAALALPALEQRVGVGLGVPPLGRRVPAPGIAEDRDQAPVGIQLEELVESVSPGRRGEKATTHRFSEP